MKEGYSHSKANATKIMRKGWSQEVTNEELYVKVQTKRNRLQELIQRKLQLFWHICRISDSRKIIWLVYTCVSYAEARNRYRLDVCPSVRHTLVLYQNG